MNKTEQPKWPTVSVEEAIKRIEKQEAGKLKLFGGRIVKERVREQTDVAQRQKSPVK